MRRVFTPSPCTGPYRLPHDVRDRLAAALMPFRNRDAAFALATFLGRFWSTPARLLTAFPVDRRELAEHASLGLTEARVRGAIRALEEVGFLDRAVASGSTHRPTPDGLHRKPVMFMFGSDYGPLFSAANKRAAVAGGGRLRAGRTQARAAPQGASTAPPVARPANSPKYKPSEAISTTAGVDEFWFCGSSVIVWRAAGVVVASPTKRGCDRGRAALPRRDARGAGAPREP